jgi:hypothetical protein
VTDTCKGDSRVIGKAEGLKVVLIEWIRRQDSVYRYYSDKKYRYNKTRGDIQEVTKYTKNVEGGSILD